jgi:hypothetical protein
MQAHGSRICWKISVLTIVIAFAFSAFPSPGPAQEGKPKSITDFGNYVGGIRITPGVFYANWGEARCNSTEERICLDASAAEEFCGRVSAVQRVLWETSFGFSSRWHALIKNGNRPNSWRVYWARNECRIEGVLSGNLNGSNLRLTESEAVGFRVSDRGDIMAATM